MLGSSILDVAIGVMFVFLVLSLVSSVINEWIASVIQQRGKNLFNGIKNLLNDPDFTGLAQQLYSHGLIDSISKGVAPGAPNRLPSYMPSSTFALALLDLLSSRGAGEGTAPSLKELQDALDKAQRALDSAPAGDGTLDRKQ